MKEFARAKCSVLNIEDVSSNPICSHGPSVLFERTLSSGKSKRFYACSAFRDRKLCSFYLEEEERSKKKVNIQHLFPEKELECHRKKYKKFLELNVNCTSFCSSCSEFVNDKDRKKHSNCNVAPLSTKLVKYPSQLFVPRDISKGEAQYFFTSKVLDTITNILAGLEIRKCLCVGTPRFHESFKNSTNIRSMLLDIDDRFFNFLAPNEFQRYNMFNHYFFCGRKSKDEYLEFLKGNEKFLLIVDPPFGGRTELLAKTISTIEGEWRIANQMSSDRRMSVILIFPYFLEKSVKENMETLSMLEYQIDYENHPIYGKGNKGMKRGSPIRMFTNMSVQLFSFPADQGYRFCSICKRSVHRANVHCPACESCTSKDGSTYVHCDRCGFCVKPKWVHCDACDRCLPVDHACNTMKTDLIKQHKQSIISNESKLKRSNSLAAHSRKKKFNPKRRKKK